MRRARFYLWQGKHTYLAAAFSASVISCFLGGLLSFLGLGLLLLRPLVLLRVIMSELKKQVHVPLQIPLTLDFWIDVPSPCCAISSVSCLRHLVPLFQVMKGACPCLWNSSGVSASGFGCLSCPWRLGDFWL